MITNILIYLSRAPRLQVRTEAGISLQVQPVVDQFTQSLMLTFSEDDEQALFEVDQLEAALDNIASAIRLRQQKREQAAQVGAGEIVEASRG